MTGAADELDRSDRDFAAAMAHGELTALESLYRRHGALLYTLAIRITGDAGSAERAVEAAFLDAWRADRSIERSMSVRTELVVLVAQAASVLRRPLEPDRTAWPGERIPETAPARTRPKSTTTTA